MLASFLRRHLDRALTMSALSVTTHARFDACQSPPAPDERPSPTEIKLKERFQRRVLALHHDRERALRAGRLRTLATDLAAEERSFDDVLREADAEAWSRRLRFNDVWHAHRRRVAIAAQELEVFRNEHALHRGPHRPNLVETIGWLAAGFVIETVLNGLLLAEVSVAGFAGGVALALSLTAPNLLLGLLDGFVGLRGITYLRPWVRACCGTLLVAGSLAAVLWNAIVAGFRLHAERLIEANQPMRVVEWQQAAADVLSDPLRIFASPQSATLFCVGLAVYLLAMAKGRSGFADPYFGFGRLDRHQRDAIAAALALKWRFYADLQRVFDRADRRVKKRLAGIDAKADEALRIINRSRAIVARFGARAADATWSFLACLRAYQHLNRRCRGGAPYPDRFDATPALDGLMPALDWRALRTRVQEISLAAGTAADATLIALQDRRLAIMAEVEAEPLDGGAGSKPVPPPVPRLATEDRHAA